MNTMKGATMEKLDGKSMDIVAENIKQLKKLFPEVFSEGKIKFDQLQELLGNYVVEDEDHYNFTWHGKRKAGRLAQTPSKGTLRPCKEESVDWDTTQNLFIEGDNLEVLKLLQKSYHRQVKMIYIDPPYNTGNDFVYKDDFKDGVKNYLELTGQLDGKGKKNGTNSSTAGRYHTNWLNMMYPRLKLARNLLRDDGVIFISIDDNEQTNLQKLCDEVFGEENFVGCLSVENNPKGRKNSNFISVSNDYVIIYCKSKTNPDSYFSENIPKARTDLKKDEQGRLYTVGKRVLVGESSNNESTFDSQKHYSVYYNEVKNDLITIKESTVESANNDLIGKGYKRYISQNGNSFIENTYTEKYLKNRFKIGALIFKSSSIYEKDFNTVTRIKSILVNDKDKGLDFKTETAGSQLKKLGIEGFTMPKNIGLLKTLQKLFEKRDYIILDFFAGSGTIAHAVMQLNSEDNGSRRHISVQLPEALEEKKKYHKPAIEFCKLNSLKRSLAELTKERIRRASKEIQKENPDYKGDLGFKVFKLDSSNIKRWEADFDTLEQDLLNAVDYIKQNRSSEDLLYELLLKYGFDLTVPIETRSIAGKTVYSIGLGALVVCLDEDINMDVVNGIGALKEELQPEIMRVVFKDDGFKDDVVKTNTLQTLKRYGIEDIKSL